MLKNTKGMTLVEMIVTIAVFSIAALVLAAGFSTVIRYMGEASAIKNTSNEVYSIIESENSKDVTYEEVYFKIQLSDGNNVDNKINRVVAEKGISDDKDAYKVKYSKFTKEVGYVDTAKTFYEQVVKEMEYCLTNQDWINKYVKTYDEYKSILSDKFKYTPYVVEEDAETGKKIETDVVNWTNWRYLPNDRFRLYIHLVLLKNESFPIIDDEIINQCNTIYKQMHPNSKNWTLEDKPYYMKPYYFQSDKKVALIAETKYNPYDKDNWRVKLIYLEGNWYYKVFIEGAKEEDSYYNIAGGNNEKAYEQLLNTVKTGAWKKVVVE